MCVPQASAVRWQNPLRPWRRTSWPLTSTCLGFIRESPRHPEGGGERGEGHPDLVPNSPELRLRTNRQRHKAPDPAAVHVAEGGGQGGRQLQPRRLGQHHRRHRGSCPVREGDQGNAGRQLHHEQHDGDVGNPDERFLLAEGNHPQPTPAHLSHRR